MPGFTFLFDKEGKIGFNNKKIDKALDLLKMNKSYSTKILYKNNLIFIATTSYNDYPLHFFENDEYLIYVEGLIYNKTNQNEIFLELISLARELFKRGLSDTVLFEEWIKKADGDYVIIALSKKTNQLLLFNDILGRLPVYISETNNQLIISRNIGFITRYHNIKPDNYGVATYLLTGYTWGDKTIFKDVAYIQPGTLFYLTTKRGVVSKKLVSFNFDEKALYDDNSEKLTDHLHELFLLSVKYRMKTGRKNVLSLSGGLDSRAIAGACAQLGIDIDCVTFLDNQKELLNDIKIAGEIASSFNYALRQVQLEQPLGKHFSELLEIKNGLNYLDMAFIIPFFKQISQDNMIYITGDGGDKVLPDLSPVKKISTTEGLLKYIIKTQNVFRFNDLSNLLNIDKKSFKEYLIEHLNTYPEKNMNNRYIRFLFYERTRKWLYEGEDRNRHYFWSVSPFYSYPLFDLSMKIPEQLKRNYKLYRQFFDKISPELNIIKNANWDIALTNKKLRIFLLKQKIKTHLPDIIKKILKYDFKRHNFIKDNGEAQSVVCYIKQLHSDNSFNEILRNNIPFAMKRLNKDQFYFLFTLSSAFELIENKRSGLLDYEYHEFI